MRTITLLAVSFFSFFRVWAAPSEGVVIGWGHLGWGPIEYGLLSGFQSNGVVAISGQILTNAVSVSCGRSFSLALTGDHKVVGWGFNGAAQELNFPDSPPLGTNGEIIIEGLPLTGVKALACGYDHSLALKDDGTVVVWGGGLDVNGRKGSEVQLPGKLRNVRAIAAGFRRTLVVKPDGTVGVWGDGATRARDWGGGPPEEAHHFIAIAAGSGIHGRHDIALRYDGTVVTWDVRGIAVPALEKPKGMSNIVAIAAGTAHVLALQDNGTVWGWGFNDNGAATGVPTARRSAAGIVHINGKALTDIKAIAAGEGTSLALKKDGTLVFWGRDFRGLLVPPPDLNGVVAIALSGTHGLAITTNLALIHREL